MPTLLGLLYRLPRVLAMPLALLLVALAASRGVRRRRRCSRPQPQDAPERRSP